MREPLSIQVFIYRLSKGVREYLLFKRATRDDLALSSFWQGISGGVETGESIKCAAIREVYEESGIHVSNLSDSVYSYSFPIKKEWRSKYSIGAEEVHEHIFVVKSDKEPQLSEEHTEFGWFKYSEAIAMLEFDESKNALSRVEDSF